VTDRFEIESLRGEFADAAMQGEYDRVGALFTADAAWRIPAANIEFTSRTEIVEGLQRLRTAWDFLIQTTHPGTIALDGDRATGRAYVHEIGRFRDGTLHINYGVFHDRYERTGEGWCFAERTYELLYTPE
jgi:ketosteroid isomerase-like protein